MFVVEIDRDRCKGCELCIRFCARDLLALDAKLNRQGLRPATYVGAPDACRGCGNCFVMCPEAAVEIREAGQEKPCVGAEAAAGGPVLSA